ncbi:putative gas vesicle protein [Rhodovulum sp. P5]|uniref:GvpL/GvpF family gas vesicle protein n=1 Tax=Rhodovulum sp. P5 TaxID=1564506 RepID=UPI0009C29EEE|nr:GvpL/GvpF family gas vesicle protein [Rhodovulum sp. P5]ARE42209.1 putative gas vesicle protein [Rhodovulum sp. P5]
MSGQLLLLGLVAAGGTERSVDQPHRRVPAGPDMDALVMALDDISEDTASEAWAIKAALAQNTVLSAYAAAEDVMPVAIGAAFSGDAALLQHLERSAETLKRQMAQLAGKTEYLFRLLPEAPAAELARPVVPPQSGVAYLKQRRAKRDTRRHLGDDRKAFTDAATAALSAAALECVVRPTRSGDAILDLSLLIRRDQVEALVEAARALSDAAEALNLRIRMVGPCAPHSFIPKAEPCDA